MSFLAMLDQAEQELAAAESALATAERYLGAPGRSYEVGEEEIRRCQAHANIAAAKCMAVAARLLVTTRYRDDE